MGEGGELIGGDGWIGFPGGGAGKSSLSLLLAEAPPRLPGDAGEAGKEESSSAAAAGR